MGGEKKGVSGWIRRQIGGGKGDDHRDRDRDRDRDSKEKDSSDVVNELLGMEEVDGAEFSLTDYDLEAVDDLRCSALI